MHTACNANLLILNEILNILLNYFLEIVQSVVLAFFVAATTTELRTSRSQELLLQ